MNEFLSHPAVLAAIPVLRAIALIIIGFILDKIARKGIERVLTKTKLDAMLHKFIYHVVQIGIWVVIVVSILGQFGIDSSSIITVLAACGAAIALALQGFLSNLASGIVIMVSHPFKSGDHITAAGVEGDVKSIDLLYTTIETAERRTITIPNSSLTNNSVTNMTSHGYRRIDIRIGVEYSSNIEVARKALVDLVNANEKTLKDPKAECDVIEYADSSITLLLRIYVNPSDYWPVLFDTNNKIKPELDKVGVGIAFPQIDVHMK